MSKLPKMYIYADTFLADTQDLSDTEFGCYCRLLMFNWGKNCNGLPSDIEKLKRITHSLESVLKGILEEFFYLEEDKYHNKKQLSEYNKAVEFQELQSEKGRLGAEKRWNSTGISTGNGTGNGKGNDRTIATNTITSTNTITNNNTIYKHFEIFWDNVSYKISKGQAKKNYSKLSKDWIKDPENLAKLYNEYYSNLKDRQFAQHPSTWLNAEGFLNEGVSYKGTLSDDDAKNIILKSKWETSKKYGKLLHNLTQNQFDEMQTLYGEK